MKHQFFTEHHRFEIHKWRNNHDDERHSEKQFDHFTNRSQTMCRMIQNSWIIVRHNQIRIDSFSSFFFSSNSEMTLKFFDYDLISSSKCKYFEMIMNSQFIWKHHFKHFEKKSFDKFNILIVLIDSIWKMNIENLKKIYFVTMLFQFIFCVSMWFVFNEEYDYKQKKTRFLFSWKTFKQKRRKSFRKFFAIQRKQR